MGDFPTLVPPSLITLVRYASSLPLSAVVKSAGLGCSIWPVDPSPLPLAPWQPAQVCSYSCFASCPWAEKAARLISRTLVTTSTTCLIMIFSIILTSQSSRKQGQYRQRPPRAASEPSSTLDIGAGFVPYRA